MCVPQKLLVSHPYKNVMTFGGCKQDFMLLVGQNVGTSATKDKATTKHVFAMDASKVSGAARALASDLLLCRSHLQEVPRDPPTPLVSYLLRLWARTDRPSRPFRPQVREITLLISSYINNAHLQKATAHHMSAPALMAAQPISLKSKGLRSKSPPALGRPSKTPTLL